MDWMTVGSLSMYAKNLRLKTQWDLKKSSGNVTGHEKLSDMLKKTPEAAVFQKQADEQSGQGTDRMRTIMDKISMGKKLTEEEKRYLQSKDPKMYTMIQAAEEERKSYEQKIKRCRTKEEMQRLRTAHLNASLTRIKAVENNPNIPADKKRELFAVETYRCERLNTVTKAFIKRGDYAKLPTEQEKNKAEKEERAAKEAERNPKAVQNPKDIQERDAAETARTETSPSGDRTETSPSGEKTPEEGKTLKTEKGESPKAESPEARKVRRAKARSAWGGGYGAYDTEESGAFSPSVEAQA